jgi:hypothetical protein
MINNSELVLKKIYLSGGMIRSGSTLLYNIARIILLEKYKYKISCGWVDDFDKLKKNKIYLIKTHSIGIKELLFSNIVFYSYRDVRESLLSFKIKFGIEPTIELCDSQIKQYMFLKNRALFFSYEELTDDLNIQINKIAKKIKVDINSDDVIQKLPKLHKSNKISSKYEYNTLMHDEHGTMMNKNDWKNLLNNNLVDEIQEKYKWWFNETGYKI